MARLIIAAILLASVTACDRASLAWLPPPPDARSLVMAIEASGSLKITARTIDPADPGALWAQSLVREPGTQASALFYRRDLASLRVPEGDLESSEALDAVALEQPDQLHVLTVDDGGDGVWRDHGELARSISSFHFLPRTSTSAPRCASFAIERIPLTVPAGQWVGNAVVGPGSVLVAANLLVLLVTVTATSVRTATVATDSVLRLFCLFDGEDGVTWACSLTSRFRATLVGNKLQLEAVGPDLDAGWSRYNEAFSGNGSVELYTLSGGGALYAGDGTQWEKVFQYPDSDPAQSQGGLVRIAPGRVLFGRASENTIYRYDRTLRSASPEYEASDQVSAIGRAGDGEILLGTGGLGVYRRSAAGAWSVVRPPSMVTSRIMTLVSYEESVIDGRSDGTLQQGLVGAQCPVLKPLGATVRALVPLGRDLLVIGESEATTGELGMSLLRRRD